MKDSDKRIIHGSLVDSIKSKWDSMVDSIDDFPYVGKDTIELMASSALNVLLATEDVADFFRSDPSSLERTNEK
jgi:hypothetical protein